MAAMMGSVSRITKYLKPYELKLHFSNKYVRSMVVYKPTSHTVVAATSQEKDLREQLPVTGDVAAAAHIAGILAARLKVKDILAVTYELRKGEKYHGKIKAFVDSLRENGILLIQGLYHLAYALSFIGIANAFLQVHESNSSCAQSKGRHREAADGDGDI